MLRKILPLVHMDNCSLRLALGAVSWPWRAKSFGSFGGQDLIRFTPAIRHFRYEACFGMLQRRPF